MAISFSDKFLNRLISIFQLMDGKSKKTFLEKIHISMNDLPPRKNNLDNIFGKWEDDRSTDEIIKSIVSSRVEKNSDIAF
jgi:hypothetical protein